VPTPHYRHSNAEQQENRCKEQAPWEDIVLHEIEEIRHAILRCDAPEHDIRLPIADVNLDIVIEEMLGIIPLQVTPGPTGDSEGDPRPNA